MNQSDIFGAGAQRLQMTDSIDLTIQSLLAYGALHEQHAALVHTPNQDRSDGAGAARSPRRT
jgi:DNA sulfur modification protein DndC